MTEIGNFVVAHWETILGVLLLLLATDGIAGYLPDKWVPYVGAVKRVAQILLTRFGKGVPIILAVLLLGGCAGLKMEETAAPMAIPPPLPGTAAELTAGTETKTRVWSPSILATQFSGAAAEVVDEAVTAANMNGDVAHAPSQNALIDYLMATIDADGDGSVADETWTIDDLNLGTASTTQGVLTFYSNEGAQGFPIYCGNNDVGVGWKLPTTVPGGADYLLNVDAVGGVMGYTDPASFQAAEATLTDIADGTIAEDLVNTANPWADNEVADGLTISGGTVNNSVIGGVTPAAGTFTTLTANAAGGLVLGAAGTVQGTARWYSNVAENIFRFDIYGADFTENAGWRLPVANPTENGGLFTVSTIGTGSYTYQGTDPGELLLLPADPGQHTLFGFDNTGNVYRPIIIGTNLSYDQASNTLSAAGGVGSGSVTTVKESDSAVGGADIVTLDFGLGFDVAESPDTEVQITFDPSEITSWPITANVALDDGTGDSPTITFQDATNETAVFNKIDSGFLTITTPAADGVAVLTGNLKVGGGSPTQAQNGEDSYVTGMLEVDGMLYADGGITVGASASPGYTPYDSDSPGTDKTAGFLGWQYVDGADGAENSDFLLQIIQDGTLTTALYFDESDDQWETTKSFAFGADPGDSGAVRLSNNTAISWEPSTPGTDVFIALDSSDVFHVGQNAASISIGTSGTGNTTIVGDLTVTGADVSVGAAGVKLTGDGDGAITLLGLGDGSDEDLTINLDDVSNEVGVSSTTGVTTLNLGSIGMVTTGSILGAMNVVVTTDGTESPTAAQMYGTMFIADHATATSDTDYTLPTAAAGMSACFYDNGAGTGGIIIDANTDDEILLYGTGVGAADAIDSPGVAGDGANGDFICLVAIDATSWITLGGSGTWVDGGAD